MNVLNSKTNVLNPDLKIGKEIGNKQNPSSSSSQESKQGGKSFLDHLKDSVQEVNQTSKTADKMAMDLTTGKSENIHETMLAMAHAELSFNFMVQVRNKALEAYQEVMRMQV